MPKFELPKLPKLPAVEVPKPVYAGAGVAGLAVEAVKEYVDTLTAVAQARRAAVTARVYGYQKQVAGFEPKSFADTVQGKATARVESLTAEARKAAAKKASAATSTAKKATGKKAPAAKKATAKKAPAATKTAAKKAPA